jgi:hypothetical protein
VTPGADGCSVSDEFVQRHRLDAELAVKLLAQSLIDRPIAFVSLPTKMSRPSRAWAARIIASRCRYLYPLVRLSRLPGFGNLSPESSGQEPLIVASVSLAAEDGHA